MSERCCGNCKYFVDKKVGGYGICDFPSMLCGAHRNNKACRFFDANSNNGWTEITQDNVEGFNTLEDRVRDIINVCLNRASRSGQEAYLEIQELSGKNHIIVLGSKENQINPFICSNGISFEYVKDNMWRFIHFSDIVTIKINVKDETGRFM